LKEEEQRQQQDQENTVVPNPPVDLGPENIPAPEGRGERIDTEFAGELGGEAGELETPQPRNQWIMFVTVGAIAVLLFAFIAMFFS
jgi:hypothetical protein